MRGSSVAGCSIVPGATTKHGSDFVAGKRSWRRKPAGCATTRRPSRRSSRAWSASSCARTSSCLPRAPLRARRAAADFHRGLSALGHDADRAGAREPHRSARGRRAVRSSRELRQFSLQQFCRAASRSRRTWPHLDGGQALRRRAVSRLLPRARRSSTACSSRASVTSPTRCRSTRSGCRCSRMAFPDAPIVRVRAPSAGRVRLDAVATTSTHGFNCGYRIEDTCHHLAAVHRLDEHYARELGCRRVHAALRALRRRPARRDRAAARVMSALPFEPACLRFHENPRYAPTPSYAQVTEQLNDRSIGRHRPYAEQLASVQPCWRRSSRPGSSTPEPLATAGGAEALARRAFPIRTSAGRRRSTRGRCRRSRAAAARSAGVLHDLLVGQVHARRT